MLSAHYWLSEGQFSKLEPYLPSDILGVPRLLIRFYYFLSGFIIRLGNV
jgi:hypothetical protein